MKVLHVCVLSAALGVGCGGASSGDGDNTGELPGEAPDASAPRPDAAPTICDEVNFAIELKPADLMIALDMSGSMAFSGKYTQARTAINNVLTTYGSTVAFGFDTYPDQFVSQSCNVGGAVWFDTAPGNAPAIQGWLNSNAAQSGAGDPLVRELDKFINDAAYAPNFMASNNAYLVVVADGDDCCGASGPYNCSNDHSALVAARTTTLLGMGIKTIAVGYTGSADEQTLNAIAQNGGTQFSTFISALDSAALETALGTVAGAIASCEFEVSELDAAMDPSQVNLYLDGDIIAFDDGCALGTGWTWTDATYTSVRLCDAVCSELNSGDPHEVTATVGCPTTQVE